MAPQRCCVGHAEPIISITLENLQERFGSVAVQNNQKGRLRREAVAGGRSNKGRVTDPKPAAQARSRAFPCCPEAVIHGSTEKGPGRAEIGHRAPDENAIAAPNDYGLRPLSFLVWDSMQLCIARE
jgi:hypothetical protein